MRVLFTPYGGGSIAHIVRSLAIADELKKRGHEILFTAPSKKKAFIESAGYEVYGGGHPEVNLNDQEDQSINYFKKNKDKFIEWLNDELAAAVQFQPHVIINSPTFFGAHVARKLSIPHVTLINAQWLDEHAGILGLSLAHNKLSHRILRTLAQPLFRRKFEKVYLKEIRGFYDALEIDDKPFRRRDLHHRDLSLVPSVPSFEPVKPTARGTIRFVGPLQWLGFEKEVFEPEKIFKDFGTKPFVYVTLGGSIYREESYHELINYLARQKKWHVLFTLGPNFPRSKFHEDTDNLKIVSFAPGLQVCKHADLLINTASHGTIMQALRYGVPVVSIPHNIDQGTIAARLVELGMGVNLNPVGIRDFTNREHYFEKATKISPSEIIRKAEAVLANHHMRKRALRYSEEIAEYDDSSIRAADLIEEYVSKK